MSKKDLLNSGKPKDSWRVAEAGGICPTSRGRTDAEMERSGSSTVQNSKTSSDRSEAELIERIIQRQKRMYEAEKSENVECAFPSSSSRKDHDYTNMRNQDGSPVLAVERRQSLYYDDPCTGRSFRFQLHRKNSRKADIYSCSKCKSRRKYVPIMVRDDKFLSDPASLDHICYMNPAELRAEHIRMAEMKRRKRCRLLPYDTDDNLFEMDFYRKSNSVMSDEVVNYAPSSPISAPPEKSAEQAVSMDELVVKKDVVLEGDQLQSDAAPLLDHSQGQMPGMPKYERNQLESLPSNEETKQTQSTASPQPSDDPYSTMVLVKDDSQSSEQEPLEPQSSPMLRSDVFLESLRMALESIPLANRQKAYVDILRYVYTTVYDKYVL